MQFVVFEAILSIHNVSIIYKTLYDNIRESKPFWLERSLEPVQNL
ncbi:MAG TPA: hypothetical protein VIH61_02965 [Waddliaceae bacterium]